MTNREDHCAHDCGETCSSGDGSEQKELKIEFFRPTKTQMAVHCLLREVLPLIVAMGVFTLLVYFLFLGTASRQAPLWVKAVLAGAVVVIAMLVYRVLNHVSFWKLRVDCEVKLEKAQSALSSQKWDLKHEYECMHKELERKKRIFAQRVAAAIEWLEQEDPDAKSLAMFVRSHFEGLEPGIPGRYVTDQEMGWIKGELKGVKAELEAEEKARKEFEEAYTLTNRILAETRQTLVMRDASMTELSQLLMEWIKQIYQSKDGSNQAQVLRGLRIEMVKYVYQVWGPNSEPWKCLEYLGAIKDVGVKADEEAA